ncbi:MAG: type II toxin-antitoxin system RelE/ParE family toxin [Bacteroidaceae bacterium]|nr:type II toxin-antitoxin system RelE/ParE family toxin [Bacteroidaceae bacterium]
MNTIIKTIPEFDRRAKRLAKKYKSLKTDLQQFVLSLQKNPIQGNHLGNGVYKIRIAFASKGGGKSGGGRIITYTVKINEPDCYEVTLLTIYDKSEISNINDTYTKELVNQAKKQY